MNSILQHSALAFLVALPPVSGGTLAAVATLERTVVANASCFGEFCNDAQSDADATLDLGPWSSSVGAAAGFAVVASAGQESHADAWSLGGTGSAGGNGGGSPGNWSGKSSIQATIAVVESLAFTVSGTLSASAFGSMDGACTGMARVRLTDTSMATVFVFEVNIEATQGGNANSMPIDLSGVLAPGAYTLRIDASVNGFATELVFGDAAAEFDVAFVLCPSAARPCPEDLDASGTVDGSDLGLLLGAWGGAGVADLDCNGIVDGADLGQLLGAWGTCEE